MKAYNPEKILSYLCQDSSDNLIYLSAILDALCHISKQIENKQTLDYCQCSNVGPDAIEPDMPVYGNGICTYCKKPVERF